jgi:hypothetical protein
MSNIRLNIIPSIARKGDRDRSAIYSHFNHFLALWKHFKRLGPDLALLIVPVNATTL